MDDFINKLIPADDLHWDSDSQRHVVLSQNQVDRLIKACFRFGLKDREIKSIIEEYNLIKSGELLYRHFQEMVMLLEWKLLLVFVRLV